MNSTTILGVVFALLAFVTGYLVVITARHGWTYWFEVGIGSVIFMTGVSIIYYVYEELGK